MIAVGRTQVRDLNGKQAVVRNGYLPERAILTGLGPVAVKVPRVKDRTGQGIRFESKLVPHYVRRAASVDAVLPWLYLRGISQADIGPAFEALVGPGTGNLSSGVISRLKQTWAAEYAPCVTIVVASIDWSSINSGGDEERDDAVHEREEGTRANANTGIAALHT